MEGLGVLIVVVAAFVANIPALPAASEGSAEVRARVAAARAIQAERFAALKHPRARTNADCDGSLLEGIAAPDHAGRTLLHEAADALGLSARAITGRFVSPARLLISTATSASSPSTSPKP